MKKLIFSLLTSLFLLSPGAQAAGGGVAWDKFPAERITDMTALQNGAKLFANYCLNCHQAAFMRYNRLRDIGLTEKQIQDNLVFTGVKVGDTMKVAMDPKDAKAWLGVLPPDLTLIARSRSSAGQGPGSDYLYTFLRTYYRDDTKLTGWNNLAYPNAAMPHALWELQGQQRAVFEQRKDPHDPMKTIETFKAFEQITPGLLSQAEYNLAIADLVAYLQWMAEPNQTSRVRLGVFVLLFLAVFTVIAWRLNASFWKDVK